MDEPSGSKGATRLKYAFDAGFLSGEHPLDSVESDGEDTGTSNCSDTESVESDLTAGLAASFRIFSESVLRMKLAELEMLKAREASRLEAEKRRADLDAELTRMLSQTQFQIASLLSRTCSNRKRKRSDDANSSTSER